MRSNMRNITKEMFEKYKLAKQKSGYELTIEDEIELEEAFVNGVLAATEPLKTHHTDSQKCALMQMARDGANRIIALAVAEGGNDGN